MLSFRVARIRVPTALLTGALLSMALLGACGDDDAAVGGSAPLTPAANAGAGGAAGASPASPESPSESGPPPAGRGAGARAGAPGMGAGGSGTSAGGTAGGGTPGLGGASGDAGPLTPTGPLPDLVLDAAYLIDTTVEDIVDTDDQCLLNEGCVTGLGARRVVRFGSRTGNIGTAEFLLGRPEASNPYWTYDACHEAYDLVGFAFYELFDATGMRVLTGVKNGFCIRDSEPWELEGELYCGAFDCNGQGISQGCADNYGSELQCQWVDITGVPAGTYLLRVTVNASRNIAELDYSNNVVEVSLEIRDDGLRVLP